MTEKEDKEFQKKLKTLMEKKFELEDHQAKDFRDIKKLQNGRMTRGKIISLVESELRDLFGKTRIRRQEL